MKDEDLADKVMRLYELVSLFEDELSKRFDFLEAQLREQRQHLAALTSAAGRAALNQPHFRGRYELE
jgi:hypothetical protein